MLNRRFTVAALALAPLSFAAPSSAAEKAKFTPAAFAAAQDAGKPILVEITASWCPTCKAQRPILSKLFADPKFKNLQVFDVDFDSQKAVVRSFGATMQSTLVTFIGKKEVGRSVGDTNAASIAKQLDKTV